MQKWDNEKYQQGYEGYVSWVEDNVRLQVYPPKSLTRQWMPFHKFPSSYLDMWEEQKEILKEALAVDDGTFRYRLIIFMWPRGEGKSVHAVLIHLWRFTCFPSQMIILGANSVGQVRFMHFEEMSRIVNHSPNLLYVIGKQNLQQREIHLTDPRGNVVSFIRPVSSFSGIYSGATGYTFSEFHQARNSKFFTEIDSSMRGVKNGLGVIDTTVAPKQHILYKLYKNYKDGNDSSLFFSYRMTEGKEEQFWNPEITQAYLNDQKGRLGFGEYEKFYLNNWGAGAEKMFSEENVEATNYLGADKRLNTHSIVTEILAKKIEIRSAEEKMTERSSDESNLIESLADDHAHIIQKLNARLWPVADIYSLGTHAGDVRLAPVQALETLGDMYDTGWAVLVGLDRADPMKQKKTAARSILTVVAKGLAGSLSNPFLANTDKGDDENSKVSLDYIYFLLALFHCETSSINEIEKRLREAIAEYDGIDAFCSERWGAQDLKQWFNENEVHVEIYHPTYPTQKAMFTEVYRAYAQGRFKTPPVPVPGMKEDDILKEEARMFDHDPEASRSKFGSPEKTDKYGVQDDAFFALGNAIYGGMSLGPDKFRQRRTVYSFGSVFTEKVMGKY